MCAMFSKATARPADAPKRIGAPAPVAPSSLIGDAAPNTTADQAAATVEAVGAAKKARKKAASGSLLTNPALAAGGAPTPKAVLTPKSLVGY